MEDLSLCSPEPSRLRVEPSLPYMKVKLRAQCPGGAELLGISVAHAVCQPGGTTACSSCLNTTQAHTSLRDVLSPLTAPRSTHSEAQTQRREGGMQRTAHQESVWQWLGAPLWKESARPQAAHPPAHPPRHQAALLRDRTTQPWRTRLLYAVVN